MAYDRPKYDEKFSVHDNYMPNVELQEEAKCGFSRKRQPQHFLISRLLPACLILLAIFSLFRTTFVHNHHYDPAVSLRPSIDEAEESGNKVPLEIHVMSKCPDARDCLRQLIVPSMQEVSQKVNLTMSFIGRYVCHNSDLILKLTGA